MNQQLINRVKDSKEKKLVYNTACLKMTEGNDYNTVYQELLLFVSKTVKESDCIEFFVTPSNLEKKEFMLWEVWGTSEAFGKHMEMTYTKEILAKNIIELKWNEVVENF